VLKVCRDIELLRKEYEKLFPPTQPIEAVSAVRICRNHDEYRLYGAPAGTAGYWNVLSEELVLFDTQALKGANKGNDANTFIVLYHEAFHQYIHYSAGGVPPHSWFNEGHGDFFSGASIAYGKVNEIGVNSWRVDEVRDALTHAYSVPWSKMIRLEKDEYYEREKVGLNYAQGWGMVYFLRKSPVVRARADWARILPTYFETLKTAFAEELERLGPEASAPLPPDAKLEAKLAYFKLREEAGKPAREKAVEAAFAGVDLTELEQAWRLYILDLPLPRAPK
jgi:hypothetical protein